jgi:hypothetical protein
MEEEKTIDVRDFKARILQEAPGSAVRIQGQDRIFYQREPGFDAILSGSGTVVYRRGWGTRPTPTRYGGVITADKILRREGYRPVNIYSGDNWVANERQHKAAKEQKLEQQTVFAPVELPKISKARESTQYNPQVYTQAPQESRLGYPTMAMPTQQNMVPRQMRPASTRTDYLNMIDANLSAIPKGQNNMIFGQLMDENKYAKYAYNSYANVQRLGSQLKVTGYGASKKPKTDKSKKGKSKKEGEEYEFSL